MIRPTKSLHTGRTLQILVSVSSVCIFTPLCIRLSRTLQGLFINDLRSPTLLYYISLTTRPEGFDPPILNHYTYILLSETPVRIPLKIIVRRNKTPLFKQGNKLLVRNW